MAKLTAQQLLSRAKSHEKKGAFDKAKQAYETLLQDYPNNLRARKALEKLQAPSPSGPSPRKQDLDALVSLYQQGQLEAVINSGKALAGRFPSSHFVFNIVGAAHGGLQQFNEAEGYFRRAAQLEPGYADSYNNLGNVLKEQQKLDEAAACYQKALEIDPGYAEAHFNLSIVLDLHDQIEQSEAACRHALAIAPNYPQAHNHLGILQLAQNHYDEAEASFTQALRLHPRLVEAHNNLGNTHLKRDRAVAALPCFAKALEIDPNFLDARINIGRTLVEQNRPDEAVEQLKIAVQTAPHDAVAHHHLGNAYSLQEEWELAIGSQLAALEIRPEFPEAESRLAKLYAESGDNDSARTVITNLRNRGIVTLDMLYVIGNLPGNPIKVDVDEELEKLARQNENFSSEHQVDIDFIRAGALHRSGDYDAAATLLKRANELAYEASNAAGNSTNNQFRSALQQLQQSTDQQTLSNNQTPMPLFILGPSRGGKSTLENLISTHPDVKRAFENSELHQAIGHCFATAGLPSNAGLKQLSEVHRTEFTARAASLVSRRAQSSPVITYTSPGLIWGAQHLATLVPNARFAFVKRDLDDVMMRIYMTKYLTLNEYAYHFDTIREYIELYYGIIDTMAARFPEIACIVHYEDMVTNPTKSVKQVADLCGLSMPDDPLPSIGDDRGIAEFYRTSLLKG